MKLFQATQSCFAEAPKSKQEKLDLNSLQNRDVVSDRLANRKSRFS